MPFDWASRRATATNLITKYGARAILRRAGVDRDCTAFTDLFTRSHQGELRNAADGLALIAADGLDEPPDAEKDQLVLVDPDSGTETDSLRLLSPIGKFAPGGVVVYWEVMTRRR
jgi:hypothetical protein